MHVFLLDLPRLEFAALIPNGEYATLILLGRDIDRELVATFFEAPQVRHCLPPGWRVPEDHCRCFPFINVLGSLQPFADRLVVIGDCGENRLYKDGIGGAYRAAKAAVNTVVFAGVSAEHFRRHYWPVRRKLRTDNAIGKLIFAVTHLIQKLRFCRRGLWRMVSKEQQSGGGPARMSGVLWDTFTRSAPYRSILWRTPHPLFLARLLYESAVASLPKSRRRQRKEAKLKLGELGRIYRPGEVIVRQGEPGECIYVIQAGKVEVVAESGVKETRLAELGEGDFFGEMALFERDVRSATVRPQGEVRVLTVDRKMFLRKIHEDPSLAFRVMQRMSRRIRELNEELAERGPAE